MFGERPQAPFAWSPIISAQTQFGAVEIGEYRVSQPVRRRVELRENVLEMVLGEAPKARMARCSNWPSASRMGRISFLPAALPIDIDWPCLTRMPTVRCLYSEEFVRPREWTRTELHTALDVQCPSLARVLALLVDELNSPGFQSERLIDNLLSVAGIELGRHLRRQATDAPCTRLSAAQLDLIDARLDVDGRWPTAAELAAACGVSRRHFLRLFRRTTGSSLADYILDRRMDRAKRLLRGRSEMIKRIAYRCGFQSSSAFALAFRRATGVSPRDYRLGDEA